MPLVDPEYVSGVLDKVMKAVRNLEQSLLITKQKSQSFMGSSPDQQKELVEKEKATTFIATELTNIVEQVKAMLGYPAAKTSFAKDTAMKNKDEAPNVTPDSDENSTGPSGPK